MLCSMKINKEECSKIIETLLLGETIETDFPSMVATARKGRQFIPLNSLNESTVLSFILCVLRGKDYAFVALESWHLRNVQSRLKKNVL